MKSAIYVILLLGVLSSYAVALPSPVPTKISMISEKFRKWKSKFKVCDKADPIVASDTVPSETVLQSKYHGCDYIHIGWHGTDAQNIDSLQQFIKPGSPDTRHGAGFYVADNIDLAWSYADAFSSTAPAICAVYAVRDKFLQWPKVNIPERTYPAEGPQKPIKLWENLENTKHYINFLIRKGVIPPSNLVADDMIIMSQDSDESDINSRSMMMMIPSSFSQHVGVECSSENPYVIGQNGYRLRIKNMWSHLDLTLNYYKKALQAQVGNGWPNIFNIPVYDGPTGMKKL
ncbi:hypothetical protein BKA69DRAFT_1101760 [Paraphysoderma sedebokerense]|nr:hypothetical protein BKA69DRAFT_1101760 [Paraphysoderma sedebokerense]